MPRLSIQSMFVQRLVPALLASVMAFIIATPVQAESGNDLLPFEVRDGDRIVFIGNTFVERAQMYGYIETALTARYPEKTFTFRNLGWSGDNVKGESRARFGRVSDGFKHLIDNAKKQKPTLLLVSYGHNAAFKGEKGVDTFIKEYKHLLDTLVKETGARVVLITPYKQEKKPAPLPDPSAYNQYLVNYEVAIRKLAEANKYSLLSLSNLEPMKRCIIKPNPKATTDQPGTLAEMQAFPITDNGMHLTRLGYFHVANTLFFKLEPREEPWTIRFSGKLELDHVNGTKLSDLKKEGDKITFQTLDAKLPLPTVPVELPTGGTVMASGDCIMSRSRAILIGDAPPGTYELRANGKLIAKATSPNASGRNQVHFKLAGAPEFNQAEQLRKAILKKNEYFFHQWRPANETYIYLFRKHEQGNNAKEMPMFDPLIKEVEEKIAILKKPVKHKYEIVRVKK